VDTADWSEARVTVDLTEPVAARPDDDRQGMIWTLQRA
jgi:hypothetical protein